MTTPEGGDRAAESLASQERLLLRIGAACAIAGPLVLALAFAFHGDLPTDKGTPVALEYIHHHADWFVIHLGMIVAMLLWVGALAALAATLPVGAAGALGRLLLPSAIVGGTFAVFDYAVDGYDAGKLAQAWAATTGPAQEDVVRMTDTAIKLLNGTIRAEIVVFYGLTVLLAGLAVALDGRYPVWFGTIGAVAGAAVLVTGAATLAELRLRVDFFVFVVVQPLEGLWLLALGVMMWRRAGRVGGRRAEGGRIGVGMAL